MPDHEPLVFQGEVPRITWAEIVRAYRPAPADLSQLRPCALGVTLVAVVEALTGTAIARLSGEVSRALAGPPRLNATAGFRWVALHSSQAANAVLTLGHTGGEIWVPIMASAAALLLAVTAMTSGGWRSGRSIVASATAVGIGLGAIASLPFVLVVVLALLSLVGFVLWAALVVVVYVVAVALAVALIVFLFWAWDQNA